MRRGEVDLSGAQCARARSRPSQLLQYATQSCSGMIENMTTLSSHRHPTLQAQRTRAARRHGGWRHVKATPFCSRLGTDRTDPLKQSTTIIKQSSPVINHTTPRETRTTIGTVRTYLRGWGVVVLLLSYCLSSPLHSTPTTVGTDYRDGGTKLGIVITMKRAAAPRSVRRRTAATLV